MLWTDVARIVKTSARVHFQFFSNRPQGAGWFAVPDPKDNQQSNTTQDDLAASIVDAWAELDKKAEAENPDEFRKAREMLAEWGNKLESLLKGKKP